MMTPPLTTSPPLQTAEIPPAKEDNPYSASSESVNNQQPVTTRLAYSVHEAAEMLGVSDKTVRRLIHRKLLRPSRALRHLLIPKKEIERFLDETSIQ
jgi:excisionase family DNA binding protein